MYGSRVIEVYVWDFCDNSVKSWKNGPSSAKTENVVIFNLQQVYLLNHTFLLQTCIHHFFQNFETHISNILENWSHNKFPKWPPKSKMATKWKPPEMEPANNEIQLYLFNCTFLMHKCIYHSSQNGKTNMNNILKN